MKVAIVGYGRMGREVARVLSDRGHSISAIIEPTVPTDAPADVYGELSRQALEDCDVSIEFSLADAVLSNARVYSAAACPAVIGTTGWLDRLDQVRAEIEKSNVGVVYGTNFSIGAHIYFAIAKYAASLVSEIEDYDLLIHEVHHRKKKDSPSGTALTLAQAVLDAVPRKTKIQTGRLDRAPNPDELHVSSSRVGSVPGTHTLVIDSPADTIEVTHQARTRGGFALGAVLAAEWVIGRHGIFPVESFVQDLLQEDRGDL